jgi:uncharacterized protein
VVPGVLLEQLEQLLIGTIAQNTKAVVRDFTWVSSEGRRYRGRRG